MSLLDRPGQLLKFILTRNMLNRVFFRGEEIRVDFIVTNRQSVLEVDIFTHPTRFQVHINYPEAEAFNHDGDPVVAWNASKAVMDYRSPADWSKEVADDFLLDLALQNPKREQL